MLVLDDFGLSATVPGSWFGRLVAFGAPGGPTVKLLQFASVPLVSDDYSFPARDTAATLGSADSVTTIAEFGVVPPDSTRLAPGATLSIGPGDFMRFQGVPLSQINARRIFITVGRGFDMLITFGSTSPSWSVIQGVNDVLGSLRIGPSAAKQANGNGVVVNG
jgi:hypothetical protein